MAMYKKLLNVGNPVRSNIPTILSRNVFLSHQRYATSYKHRTMEKKLGLPPKPKRPLTPFIQYTRQQRKTLSITDPTLSSVELLKKMGESWHTVDANEKEKLKGTYKKELEEYTKQIMAYEESLTDEQKKLIQMERSRLSQVQEKQKMKSRLIELGRPKRPAPTFVLYMLSKLNTRSKDLSFPEWLSTVAKEWANLPADAKTTFQNESKKLMEQYEHDMVLWESKMIKMGHIDVVRRHVLLDLKGKNNVPKDETANN